MTPTRSLDIRAGVLIPVSSTGEVLRANQLCAHRLRERATVCALGVGQGVLQGLCVCWCQSGQGQLRCRRGFAASWFQWQVHQNLRQRPECPGFSYCLLHRQARGSRRITLFPHHLKRYRL